MTRIFLEVLRQMTARAIGDPGAWLAGLGYPLLAGLHGAGADSFGTAALAALPFSLAAALGIGWHGSPRRRHLADLLRRTPAGEPALVLAETVSSTAAGALAGWAFLYVATLTGTGAVPWQAWPVPFLCALSATMLARLSARWAPGAVAPALAIPGVLALASGRHAIVLIAAFPAHLAGMLAWRTGEGGLLHPDACLAASLLTAALSVVLCHVLRRRRGRAAS